MLEAVLDPLVAACFCLFGLAMWRRRLATSALLMVATGLTWLAGGFVGAIVFAHRGPLVHLLVSYPRNRLRYRSERVVIGSGYLAGALYPLGRLNAVTTILAVAMVAVVAGGYHRARGAERRARLTSLLAACTVGSALALGAAARLAERNLDHPVLIAYELALTATSMALFADARWGRWNRSAITNLVLDLGNADRPASLRDKLANALGDPSLLVGYPAPDHPGLVNEKGTDIELPPPALERAVTIVRDGEQEIAVLVHDGTVSDDPALLKAVASLAKIALANARLQAAALATIAAIEASRRRLLLAADTERERLEAELQAGAQNRLARVASLLEDQPDEQGLRDQLRLCRDAVADFARGVHPRVLSEQGLSAALRDLAAEAPLPVELDVRTRRHDHQVEAAAYYVCAEALTNIAKYASATLAWVRVSSDTTSLRVEIRDDGVGGANPAAGSGLVGLADRLDALGGKLTVDSPVGTGTRVTAIIPLIGP